MKNNVSYLLIGAGRLSQHLSRYFSLLGLEHQVWSRQQGRSALVEKASNSTHVLCLIHDSAIEPFLVEHESLWRDQTVVHASGTLSTLLAEGAHPLLTFTPIENETGQNFGSRKEFDQHESSSSYGLHGLETYKSIPFITENGRRPFSEILPGLPNPHWSISPAQKPLYHALCVLAGNFTTILWQKVIAEFATKFDLPPESLMPYLRQIARNIESHPNGALTGPLARGDQKTIDANLQALGDDPFADVYQAFVDAYSRSTPHITLNKIGGSS